MIEKHYSKKTTAEIHAFYPKAKIVHFHKTENPNLIEVGFRLMSRASIDIDLYLRHKDETDNADAVFWVKINPLCDPFLVRTLDLTEDASQFLENIYQDYIKLKLDNT